MSLFRSSAQGEGSR